MIGKKARQWSGNAEGEEGEHRVDREDGRAIAGLGLAVEQGGVGRAVESVHRVCEEIGRDQLHGREGESHDDDAQGVEPASEHGRARHPPPLRELTREPCPQGKDAPTDRGHRAHEGTRRLRGPEHFLQPQGQEGLEGDHADRPADLGHDEAEEHPVATEEKQAVLDDRRRLLDRGEGPSLLLAGRDCPRSLLEQGEGGDQVDDVEGREDGDGEVDGGEGLDGVPPDEGSGQERPGRHPDAEHGALLGEFLVHIRAGCTLVDGVDEPCLQWPRVQRAKGTHEGCRPDELPEVLREEIGRSGHDIDAGGRDIDRTPTEGVGEPARRQLQGETDEPRDGGGGHGLRDRQAAVGHDEDEDPDDETDREPAGEVEQQEDPVGPLAGQGSGPHRRGTHRRGTCSMSTG